MQDKLQQLEILITQLISRQKELAGENVSLKNKLRVLEAQTYKLKEVEQRLKEVSDWKKNAQVVLRRVAARLDKEIEKAKTDEEKIG